MDPYFVVQVRTGAAAAKPNVTDRLSAREMLAVGNGERRHVTVAGDDAVTVIYFHQATIAVHFPGKDDHAIRRSQNTATKPGRDINAAVECPFSVEGIDTLAERTCNPAGHGPKSRGFGHAKPIGQRGRAAQSAADSDGCRATHRRLAEGT